MQIDWMKRALRSILLTAAALAVLGFSAPVFGETPSFQELIGQAKEAFDEGDFDTAIERLVDANRMQPNSRLLLNIARSYAKTDDCASAAAYYWSYVSAPDSETDLAKVAEKEFDELECDAYDPEASGRVLFDSTPPGAQVSLSGDVLGTTPFEAVQLPAGSQTFRFELEGRQTVEESVSVEAAQQTRVSANLPEVVVEPEPQESEPTPMVLPKTQEKDLTMVYVASGVTAVGVGLLVVGAIFDLSVIPSTDDERAQTEVGSARYDELTDQRSSQSTIALVSYISGATLAVGGGAWLTYLLLTDSAETDSDRASIVVAPQIGAETVGVGFSGRF